MSYTRSLSKSWLLLSHPSPVAHCDTLFAVIFDPSLRSGTVFSVKTEDIADLYKVSNEVLVQFMRTSAKTIYISRVDEENAATILQYAAIYKVRPQRVT